MPTTETTPTESSISSCPSLARQFIPFLAFPEGLGGAMDTTCNDLRNGIDTTAAARNAPLLSPQEDDDESPAVRGRNDDTSFESNLVPERAVPQAAAMVEGLRRTTIGIGDAELRIEPQMRRRQRRGDKQRGTRKIDKEL